MPEPGVHLFRSPIHLSSYKLNRTLADLYRQSRRMMTVARPASFAASLPAAPEPFPVTDRIREVEFPDTALKFPVPIC